MTWTPRSARAEPGSLLAQTLAALPAAAGLSREFPPEALAEAHAASVGTPLPDADATDIPFVTIDPPHATDLDQALAIDRDGAGWVVHYAISDLPSFVRPGGALNCEALKRGTTVYLPDGRIPLHPPVLGDDAASLLPDRVRGAYVWRFDLDATGSVTTSQLHRARIRSRAQLSYDEAQAVIDTRRPIGAIAELPAVGRARLERERARGGASLNSPEIIVDRDETGYSLRRRRVQPIERWNAQVSLMTGMTAAQMMLEAGIGILRTMPPAAAESIRKFRQQTSTLGLPWDDAEPYGSYLSRLDGADPAHLAIMNAAAALFRGAGYTAFVGAVPEHVEQAALAAPYAHVTAPLRRLVDRFALELCLAIEESREIPSWLRRELPQLPEVMATTGALAARLDRESTDIIEAAVLSSHVGDVFDAAIVAPGRIQLVAPAVEARADGADAVGRHVAARLIHADIATGTVRFAVEN